MNRIESIFADRTARKGRLVMPFVTAGYPTLDATEAVLIEAQKAGAAICEIGLPFSDPIADGPVIAASMTVALKAHLSVDDIFASVRRVRSKLSMGLVAMVSYSIVYRMGVRRFVKSAAESGFDGFIFPDLPLEEAQATTKPVLDAGLISSLLIAPTTPLDRAKQIASASSGFIYLMARTGITGERSELPPDLADRVAALRQTTKLPIAVGFGISSAKQVRAVTDVADAAIVGSALVRRIGEHAQDSPQRIGEQAGRFIAELVGG